MFLFLCSCGFQVLVMLTSCAFLKNEVTIFCRGSLSLYLIKRTSAWIWWFCCLVRSCRVSTRTISVIYVIMNLNISA